MRGKRSIEAVRRRAVAVRAHAALLERQDRWEVALSAALAMPPAGLPALLARSDQTLAQSRESQRRRTQLETRHAQAAKELRDAQAAEVTAREELRRLAGAVAGRAAGTRPSGK